MTAVTGFNVQGTANIPDGALTDRMFSASSPAGPTKVQHQFSIGPGELFATATTVTAVTKYIWVTKGTAGTIQSISAAITGTVPTGGDSVTVDLKKSTGGGSLATVLSSTVILNSSSVLRTAQSGTISSASTVAGDLLAVVVTVSGSSGAGLVVTVTVSETPT